MMKLFHTVKLIFVVLLMILAFPALGDTVRDTFISTAIKTALVHDNITATTNITIETLNGVVTLRGVAASETEATKAIEIAASTEGVRRVNANNLKVQGNTQPLMDAYITAKVKGVFIKNNVKPGESNVPLGAVKVETRQGIVYLSGAAQNMEQVNKMIMLAKSVDGVSQVVSTLQVNS